jgi:hypothetical protein
VKLLPVSVVDAFAFSCQGVCSSSVRLEADGWASAKRDPLHRILSSQFWSFRAGTPRRPVARPCAMTVQKQGSTVVRVSEAKSVAFISGELG